MSDSNDEQIKVIFALKNCIMAIIETGETLQKISNPSTVLDKDKAKWH